MTNELKLTMKLEPAMVSILKKFDVEYNVSECGLYVDIFYLNEKNLFSLVNHLRKCREYLQAQQEAQCKVWARQIIKSMY